MLITPSGILKDFWIKLDVGFELKHLGNKLFFSTSCK